ncbi:hypothetical protein A5662_06690 [Mycobacteriaceae bacterium 1482268.1]|nr:hypothetical protein A5662_06690 [Mycobacteriaceae bacterium 1482268.1]
MEDQPTDSGDLTTDSDSTAAPSTPRPRHRMPSGKRLRAAKPEPETAAVEEDAPAVAPGTTETAVVDEETAAAEEPAAPKSRRRFLRRRKKEPEVAESSEVAESTDVAEDAEDATEAEAAQEAPAEGVVLVPHRPAGKWLKIAAAAAAVLFVAGGGFLGATAQPVIANRALVETKLDIARTAADAITTLWSYTPENMDSLGERSASYLSGDFGFQYRKFIDSIVATNKQAQVTNTTSVLGTAVESVNQADASAIVYTNSVATSPVSKNIPSLRYLSYRLEMKRVRSDWRITRMATVTTLDLTPQL